MIPDQQAPLSRHIPITHVSAVHRAAQTARSVAFELGLPSALPDQAAVIASELASNLEKHAGGGEVYVQPALGAHGVEILAADAGPGMDDLARCLADGHTTTGTLGAGLGAVLRMATDFDVHTVPGEGTLAVARVLVPRGRNEPPYGNGRLGYLRLAAPGEEVSGDTLALAADGEEHTLLMVDGLGHGPDAAEAARAAAAVFAGDPHRPLPALLSAVNAGIRHTRGAAAAVLRVRPGLASFCGVGNVNAVLITGGRTRHLLSQPGIVGRGAVKPLVRPLDLEPDAIAVLHTDGVDARWSLGAGPGPALAPALLAARLMHRHRRSRDDATVLALRVDGGAGAA
ncbi:hypothetical protein CFN78_22145 [Amycolatopsis antarctica]|uniref:PPM-type phosphatase domain-containing protein n=1 Tax=Amycolatopsis antarctica TaxID=1854586 RepID=A0A263CZ04_9PSEU|nr:ATP-binding protein [Amycolatopsis antarctica]OZM71199.1 hypothetical protein CFN78_22145 [Amycolatopsis antarctica]